MRPQPIKITAVIPAYNESTRIGRAIRSVLAQTRAVTGILVVDDGSTDDTSAIAEGFGQFVTCVRQPNRGLAAARNTGIAHAPGDWIAFLDADDQWLPGHIEAAVATIALHPSVNWYFASFERRTAAGEIVFQSSVQPTDYRDGLIENYFFAQAKDSFSLPSSAIVRKNVFAEVGLFDEQISHFGEDLDMWFRIACRYPRLGYSQRPGCIYWLRPGSITSSGRVDIPRFLRRIETTRRSATALTRDPVPGSHALIRRWVIDATKLAIKQNDKECLSAILDRYAAFLPMQWRACARFAQTDVGLAAAHAGHRLLQKRL